MTDMLHVWHGDVHGRHDGISVGDRVSMVVDGHAVVLTHYTYVALVVRIA